MSEISYNSKFFFIGGKKVRIAAGAMHYFRIPRELWRDRIEKAKLSGLNTIETYFAWNAHEYEEGRFDFSGMLDIDAFFSECERAGMCIIARPGPFICAEWDNGGFPAWLNVKPGIKLRSYNKPYLSAVGKFFDRCIPVIEKHQYGKGGNVIMVQIENEYLFPKRAGGKKYMEYLRDDMRARGITVPLSSCDHMAQPVKGVLQTHNNSEGFARTAKAYRKAYPKAPFLVSEYWTGWFDSWGKGHNTRDTKTMARRLREIAGVGGMYIQYMFHGGTNFGFWGGRTVGNDRVFMTASYDYDAPLSETGQLTAKFVEFSRINYAMQGLKVPKISRSMPPRRLPALPKLSGWKAANPVVGGWRRLSKFEPFEKLGRYTGYGLYRARFCSKEAKEAALYFTKYGDRIKVFANGEYRGTFGRGADKNPIRVNFKKGDNELLFLVDNMGRFNYSLSVGELKGIFGPVFTEAKAINPVWTVKAAESFRFVPDRARDREVYGCGGELLKVWPNEPPSKRKFLKAEASFSGVKGKRYFTRFMVKDYENKSLFLNGKQFYYGRNSHINGGIVELEVTKYVREGKNLAEVYHEGSDADFLKSCSFAECSGELSGEISFAAFEPLAKGRRISLKPIRIWKSVFELDWPAFPIRLRMDGMGKGQIYLNGINIGRYWQPKPQRDYYLPEPWLKGRNEIMIFEEEGNSPEEVCLVYDSSEAFVG